MKNLSKTYIAKDVEDEIYQKWESSGFFNPDNLEKAHDRFWNTEPFSIAMPPPNATGELHMGHALMLTLEDIITRHARMSGKKTLWLPGTDHAAIATQNVVERKIWEQDKKTRKDVGREELLKKIEEFVSRMRGKIQFQIRKMGSSCDWSREKYTLSPELSIAVRTIFKKMYDTGLIYRGEQIVNWCPRCGTTLADDEVVYHETLGKFYFIRYPFPKSKGGLTIATTRPETMLADTAVAVHPADTRYKKFIGRTIMLPLVNRELPIVADDGVDRKFGTGVLKVTPGHDILDFAIGKRHKLEIINLFTPEGKIDEKEAFDHGFEEYAGLTAAEAREKIVQALNESGYLEKTEDLQHNVGTCYRCGTVVEPIVSKQWFISVSAKFKVKNEKFRNELKLEKGEVTLKEICIAAVKSGAVKIIPKRFEKNYFQWMVNLRDWNISRQIWFGHRIPVYYCRICGNIMVEIETPKVCDSCQSPNLKQDPDTLDTWFSSSLWTFSTLGWPQETQDLKTFHPTTILETGYDILFFWVARMVMLTGFALEDIPFRRVLLHGLVRDIAGKKMSKSKGNVTNPVEIIKKYGADALRLALVIGITPGNDLKIFHSKIENSRNLVNKLWNISRFVLSESTINHKDLPKGAGQRPKTKLESLADDWILEEFESLKAIVGKHFENHQHGLIAEALYDFTWHKFADWYLEISKAEGQKSNSKEVLPYILSQLLRLWHPFIPFVTEHIWGQSNDSLLMTEDYPLPSSLPPDGKGIGEGGKFRKLQELITGLRNLRAEYHQPQAGILASYLEAPKDLEWVKDQTSTIERLAQVKLNFEKLPSDKKMPYFIWENTRIYLVIPHFDAKKELGLAEKELKYLENRAKKLQEQLNKKDFLKKAPSVIVNKTKTDFGAIQSHVLEIKTKIKSLK